MQTKKAIRYLRFSKDGQSNSSIEWQDTYTAQYCSNTNIVIQDTFIDAGHSAKTFDRPDFGNLSAFIRKHYREVDFLIVNQMDRFSRDAGEALSLVKKLQKQFSIQIISVTEGIIFDYHTPGSFFRTGLQLLLAEDDNINRAQKINSGIYTSKAREGRFIGSAAPYGYVKEGERKLRHLQPVEPEASVIRYIYDAYLRNEPLGSIYAKARAMGLKAKGNSTIPKILSNPVYSGQLMVKPWKDMPGGLFPAQHEAIIDLHTWNQVQHKMKQPARAGISMSDEMPLRGLLHCHCGRSLTGAPSKGKLGGYYYYYKCNTASAHNNISAKKAHAQLQEILQLLSLPEYIVSAVKEDSQKQLDQQLHHNKKQLLQVRSQLDQAEADLLSLEEKWIRNQVSHETYSRWYNDSVNKRVSLKTQIESLSRSEDQLYTLLQENLIQLTDMQFVFNSSSIEHKQELLRKVFDNRLYYKENIYRTPYMMEIFHHNTLILKQKQLLIIDEKRDSFLKVPSGGAAGNRTLVQTYPS